MQAQDTLIDLLGSDKQARLKTKTNPSTGIVQVDGAHICMAENAQMLKSVFERGLRQVLKGVIVCVYVIPFGF